MRNWALTAICATALLTACSENAPRRDNILDEGATAAPQNKFGFMEAREQPSVLNYLKPRAQVQRVTNIDVTASPSQNSSEVGSAKGSSIPVSLPKIAYTYSYGYRMAGERIAELQRKHADYCELQGQQVCRIVELSQNGDGGPYASGSLRLQVISPKARAFGAELAKIASGGGAKEVASSISGQDLSKKIVDTEARLRTRETLRNRLMEVLATRKGTVDELIEAERGVAAVNEEIEQARSWLAEMQGLVEFSDVRIRYGSEQSSYEPEEQSGTFMTPIRGAFANVGAIIGTIIGLLILALAILVPLGLILWAIRAIWLRVRDRLPHSLVYATPKPEPAPAKAGLEEAADK